NACSCQLLLSVSQRYTLPLSFVSAQSVAYPPLLVVIVSQACAADAKTNVESNAAASAKVRLLRIALGEFPVFDSFFMVGSLVNSLNLLPLINAQRRRKLAHGLLALTTRRFVPVPIDTVACRRRGQSL